MDDDTVIGAAKQVAGRIEQKAGNLAGDRDAEIRGAARELGGATQRTFGEAKDNMRSLVGGRSAASLLAAVAVGLVVGMFLRR